MARRGYAEGTGVSVERSRSEIESTLMRFGASQFAYAWRDGTSIIDFVVGDRRIRFLMKLPLKTEERFTHRKHYSQIRENSPEEQDKLWEQACRQNWRALALLVKAKFAGVEAGITTFEEEFLAHIVIPSGNGRTTTASEWLLPQLEAAYKKDGGLKELLLLPSG